MQLQTDELGVKFFHSTLTLLLAALPCKTSTSVNINVVLLSHKQNITQMVYKINAISMSSFHVHTSF